MKKFFLILLTLALCGVLTACGGQRGANDSSEPQTPPAAQPQEMPESSPDEAAPDSAAPEGESGENDGILIAYFTYGENALLTDGVDASTSASIQYRGDDLTGNTGIVAGMITEATGGELFSILTAEQYPDNYDDTLDAAQNEAGSRPELVSHIESLDAYGTVFLGFPNWWGDMPMAVYSFLDEYDLSGKTIVPFVTSGGSGFSGTIRAIESAEPNATVLEGLSIGGSRSVQAEADVIDWLTGLGFAG